MRIEVVKCSAKTDKTSPFYMGECWYKDKIGEQFNVIDELDTRTLHVYRVKEGGLREGDLFVRKEDVKIVEE